MNWFTFGVLWNIFLAVVPVGLGYAVAELGKQAATRRNIVIWGTLILVFFFWLALVPNTCYLLTQWRHLLSHVDRANLYQRAQDDQRLLLDICKFALFFLLYSGVGALTLALSIRPVERMLRLWRWPFPLVAPPLFILLSTGVYLGLIVRLNSWDLWTRPHLVWDSVASIPQRPYLVLAILVFAVLLWGLYEALDLWIDGVEQRMRGLAKR